MDMDKDGYGKEDKMPGSNKMGSVPPELPKKPVPGIKPSKVYEQGTPKTGNMDKGGMKY